MKADKNWTYEEAAAAETEAHDQWLRDGCPISKKGWQIQRPFFHWLAMHKLDLLEEQYQSGTTDGVVMYALHICFLYAVEVPDWAAEAFLDIQSSVASFEHKSWDDAFGRPHPLGTKISSKRNRFEKGIGVILRIRNLRGEDPTEPMDPEKTRPSLEESYQIVADEFDQGTDWVEKIWKSRNEPFDDFYGFDELTDKVCKMKSTKPN